MEEKVEAFQKVVADETKKFQLDAKKASESKGKLSQVGLKLRQLLSIA